MTRFWKIAAVILICVFASDRAALRNEIDGLRAKVLNLNKAVEKLEEKALSQNNNIEASQATHVLESSPSPTGQVLPSRDSGTFSPPEPPASSFEISARIAGVSSLISLSAEEKSEIAAAAAAKNGFSDEILQSVLGEERFINYAKKRAEFEESMRQEISENELFSLSRKLALSQEQEPRIREIIALSREKFMPRRGTPEWSALPMGERERSIVLLRKEIARQKFLTENLRSILTDEQNNKYLELQASSTAAQSHSGFLDEAEAETSHKE